MVMLALKVPEAAAAIQVSRSEAYRLIYRGLLPSVRIGGNIRVPLEALTKMVNGAATLPQTVDRP